MVDIDHLQLFNDRYGHEQGNRVIVAVADAYDVMTSARSYKKPLSEEAAREELARNAVKSIAPGFCCSASCAAAAPT